MTAAPEIIVDVHTSDDACIATASYHSDSPSVTVTATSKRHPHDPVNLSYGIDLAIARALIALGNAIADQAIEAVLNSPPVKEPKPSLPQKQPDPLFAEIREFITEPQMGMVADMGVYLAGLTRIAQALADKINEQDAGPRREAAITMFLDGLATSKKIGPSVVQRIRNVLRPPALGHEATEILDEIAMLNQLIDSIENDNHRMRLGNEIHGKLLKLRDRQEYLDAEQDSLVLPEVIKLVDRTLTEVFGFQPDEVAQVKLGTFGIPADA